MVGHPDRHAATHNVSAEDANILKTFADDLVSGTANEEQASQAVPLLKKFGPAGAALWEQMKDIAARTLAAMAKPY